MLIFISRKFYFVFNLKLLLTTPDDQDCHLGICPPNIFIEVGKWSRGGRGLNQVSSKLLCTNVKFS